MEFTIFAIYIYIYIISLSPAPRAAHAGASTKKKICKKSRYFRLPPNLAHRKLIALANYVPSFSSLRVLSFTQRFFKNVEKMAVHREKYLGCLDRTYLPTLPVFPAVSKFFIKSPGLPVRAPNLPDKMDF